MKRNMITMIIIVSMVALVFAAPFTNMFKSDGLTPVTIVDAPAASTSRMIPAKSLKIVNTAATNVSFWVQLANTVITNKVESLVDLAPNDSYYNDAVIILSGTTNTLEVQGITAFGTALDITVHYSDQGQ